MLFNTHFYKDPPSPSKMCLKTNIDKRIYNLGFLLYTENLNVVIFHQYSTSNTFVLKNVSSMPSSFILHIKTFEAKWTLLELKKMHY